MTAQPVPLIPLGDDECVLNREGVCVRADVRHHRDVTEVLQWGSVKPVAHAAGPCRHRACHRVPVESTVDDQVLAHLCRACDAQLP